MTGPGEAAADSDEDGETGGAGGCAPDDVAAGALDTVAGGAGCAAQAETVTSLEGFGAGEGLAGALDALAAPAAGADGLAGSDAGDIIGTEGTAAAIAGICAGIGGGGEYTVAGGALATRSDATFNVRFAPESLLAGVGGRVAPGTPPDCR